MRVLLDTNICIYLIKQKPPQVLSHFQKYTVGEIGISSISLAELRYGIEKSHNSKRNAQALEKFLIPLIVAPFGASATYAYGKIRSALEAKGTPIGPLDTLIAAHALCLNVTLVTNNTKEFARVPKLKLKNWAE